MNSLTAWTTLRRRCPSCRFLCRLVSSLRSQRSTGSPRPTSCVMPSSSSRTIKRLALSQTKLRRGKPPMIKQTSLSSHHQAPAALQGAMMRAKENLRRQKKPVVEKSVDADSILSADSLFERQPHQVKAERQHRLSVEDAIADGASAAVVQFAANDKGPKEVLSDSVPKMGDMNAAKKAWSLLSDEEG